MKTKRLCALLLSLAMMVCISSNAFAASFIDGTQTPYAVPVAEEDDVANDNSSGAQSLVDDNTVSGSILSRTDRDWYCIEFSEDGWANFWSIGTNCNLDLELYTDEGDSYEADGYQNTANNQTYIEHFSVKAGVKYYFKLSATKYSPYEFRVRFYNT